MAQQSTLRTYNQQNRTIHKALQMSGMSYNEDKEELMELINSMTRRKIDGLSALTIGERDKLIRHFQKRGLNLFKPFVNKEFMGWRKGDAEIKEITTSRPLRVPEDRRRLVGKIGAVLADLKLPWSYADGISTKMFNINKVEWCSPQQLYKIVAALAIYQRRQYA
ncbi:phage protein GemA/Gp16 family protein [Desulfobacula sp.]|uniref:phage protein GemA/Gp16 family protein n=1 Tax=Desulfobacula sp. TaxID=2593537 RepID=UPI0025C61C28|nr:phage protein GemA/Gp16 family protein [Desulfobacula sp.]MBC2703982.1 DUF1018 domain-containing protein [Desulfobacula sp.]